MLTIIEIVEGLEWYPVYHSTLKVKGGARDGRARSGHPAPLRTKGVYLLKENGVVTYVGMSMMCLRERYMRKLQARDNAFDRHFGVVTYKDKLKTHQYQVAFILEADKDKAAELERTLIGHFKPRDNTDHIDYVPDPTDNPFPEVEGEAPF